MQDSDINSSPQRQRKQEYLISKIINQGYNATKFTDYLCTMRQNGDNIDVWEFKELEEVVQKFIQNDKERAQNPKLEDFDMTTSTFVPQNGVINQQPQSILQEPPKEGDIVVNQVVINQQPMSILEEPKKDASPNINQNGFVDQNHGESLHKEEKKQNNNEKKHDEQKNSTFLPNGSKQHPSQFLSQHKIEKGSATEPIKGAIQIKKLEETPLGKEKNPKVSVVEPVYVKGGLFSGGYVQYTIKTEPLGWTVKRRYNDFFWLRDTLHKLHPGVFIPPIPKKKNKNKFQEEVIRKRMYFFEIFLNACLEQEDLKADKFLCNFLNLPEEGKFNNIKKIADQTPRIDKIENLASASGEIILDKNPDFQNYATLSENYITQTEPIYKKIKKLTNGLLNHMKQSVNLGQELGRCFRDLHMASNEFNKKVPARQSLKFEEIYPSLTKTMLAWCEDVQKQAVVFHKNLLCFFKYTSLEDDVFREMNVTRSRLQADNARQSYDLLAKKEKLFIIKDPAQWELDEDKARKVPREQLLEDKDLAFELMLSRDTQQLKYQNNMLAYLNASTYNEISKGMDIRAGLYKKNFQEFITKQTDNMKKLEQKWSEILSKIQGVPLDTSIKSSLLSTNSYMSESVAEK